MPSVDDRGEECQRSRPQLRHSGAKGHVSSSFVNIQDVLLFPVCEMLLILKEQVQVDPPVEAD